MTNEGDRYTAKPLLRLVELWVQWVIGEIDPQDLVRLRALEPNLRQTWQIEGSWNEMIESILGIQPQIQSQIQDLWKRNREIANQNPVESPVEIFSRSVADRLIGAR